MLGKYYFENKGFEYYLIFQPFNKLLLINNVHGDNVISWTLTGLFSKETIPLTLLSCLKYHIQMMVKQVLNVIFLVQ